MKTAISEIQNSVVMDNHTLKQMAMKSKLISCSK